MMTPDLMKQLIRRTVEIDFRYKHRHLPGTLSALPIIAMLYDQMRPADVFILSKGHSCAALYAVLEHRGFKPDVTKVHPERDPANGITITAGSLGHGLPIGVGIALARKRDSQPGIVHVLMGDGECLEGTTWEALHIAGRFQLRDRLHVHIDCNFFQGSDALLCDAPCIMPSIYPSVFRHYHGPGHGVRMFENNPGESTHTVTDEEFAAIMEELK